MSFRAELQVKGNTYSLTSCEFGNNQSQGMQGNPTSVTRSNPIVATVESTDDKTLWEWSCDDCSRETGSLVFYAQDSQQVMKQLDFTDAYVCSYKERFNVDDTMVIEVTISAGNVSMGNGEILGGWPV
jgi:hypothetical protein